MYRGQGGLMPEMVKADQVIDQERSTLDQALTNLDKHNM